MTEDMIKDMQDRAMAALYNAVCRDNKVTTVQGMCDIITACYEYCKTWENKKEAGDTL